MTTIIVDIKPINGFGDLSCGVKIAKILKTPERIVILAIPDLWRERLNAFAGKEFSIISTQEAKETKNAALRIFAPIESQDLVLSESDASSPNVIGFYEYGYLNPAIPSFAAPYVSTYSMGLNDREIGILIDPDWEWQHSISQLAREKRFQTLENHTQWGPLLSEMQKTLQLDPTRDLLFLGYASNDEERISFIKKIAAAHQNEGKRLIFMLPHFLHGHTLDIPGNMTLITDPLTPDQFKLMLLLSEPECLITGDQSLSEAISANKEFTYEVRGHKQRLQSALIWLYQKKFSRKATNKEICQNRDCGPRMKEIIEKALACVRYPQNNAPHQPTYQV